MNKFLAMLLVMLALASCSHKESEAVKAKVSAGDTVPEGKDSLTVELVGRDSVNVLDLLRENHSVVAKSTAVGSFVTEIDSIKGNSTLFWVYSVNGKSPDVACDKCFAHKGDRVIWHLRKF